MHADITTVSSYYSPAVLRKKKTSDVILAVVVSLNVFGFHNLMRVSLLVGVALLEECVIAGMVFEVSYVQDTLVCQSTSCYLQNVASTTSVFMPPCSSS